MEGAQIHAENAIRQKNQALNFRRMSARIDAVSQRVYTAISTKQVWNITQLLGDIFIVGAVIDVIGKSRC